MVKMFLPKLIVMVSGPVICFVQVVSLRSDEISFTDGPVTSEHPVRVKQIAKIIIKIPNGTCFFIKPPNMVMKPLSNGLGSSYTS